LNLSLMSTYYNDVPVILFNLPRDSGGRVSCEAIVLVLLVCVRNRSDNSNTFVGELNKFSISQDCVTFMDPTAFFFISCMMMRPFPGHVSTSRPSVA
jgi:hypothetical protein